ncbi:hypothetical protein ACFO0A_01940 [Novosphingobium tardum]|uniref:Hpr(Ser) kinase/phosphatase n=1 Tax=Novosphingobium tardum TaxID=1538021 RepID=A0ABV8RL55_9SPHN
MSPEPALRDPPASDLALPAARLMERETRRRFAPVAAVLDGIAVEPGHSLLRGDAFVLNAGRDIVFHYRRGEGVTVSAPPQAEAGEVELWFNGSVYAAIASLNGLLPFHASAIAHEGRVHAFSAPPGGGKSTLTAALGREGFALFCDDTLILDISDPDRIMCLPGHKRLKLWPDALDLTGATGEEQVSAGYPKVFASPSAGAVSQAAAGRNGLSRAG